jgi:hypothetical protein
MSRFELAQMNVARLRAPLDSPQLADFVGGRSTASTRSRTARWALSGGSRTTRAMRTALQPMGVDIIINMSVWKDAQSLQAFTYRSNHAGVMSAAAEWFEKMDLYLVLWWVPRGPSALAGRGHRAPGKPASPRPGA